MWQCVGLQRHCLAPVIRSFPCSNLSQLVQLIVLPYAIIRVSIKGINKCLSALERTDLIFQTDGLLQVYSICQKLVVPHLMDPDDGDKAGPQNTGGQQCKNNLLNLFTAKLQTLYIGILRLSIKTENYMWPAQWCYQRSCDKNKGDGRVKTGKWQEYPKMGWWDKQMCVWSTFRLVSLWHSQNNRVRTAAWREQQTTWER